MKKGIIDKDTEPYTVDEYIDFFNTINDVKLKYELKMNIIKEIEASEDDILQLSIYRKILESD